MREFETGATRDTDDGKYDYEGFFSPLVLRRRAEYMHQHRIQSDGKLRDSDNWQKGIPLTAYIKSLWRHFMDVWLLHRGYNAEQNLEESLCAMMFNTEGMLHELLSKRVVTSGGTSGTAEGRLPVQDHRSSETPNQWRVARVREAPMDWTDPGERIGF